MDNILEPNFIIQNVEKIFNKNSEIKNYKVIYDDIEAHVELTDLDVPAFVVTSGSNYECIFFYCYNFNNNYYLQTQGIHKCNNEKSSGKFNILCLLEFCNTYNYDYMIISEDQSLLYFNFINYQPISISLMKLKLLTNGISWYNSLGFYSKNNAQQIIQIKNYINLPILIIVRNNQNIMDITNYILNITKSSIKDKINFIFKKINNIIKINCPQNNCDISFYNTLQVINQFIDIIYHLSGINYDNKFLIHKMKNNNKNINEINDDIENYLGGNIRKYNKNKIKSKKRLNRKIKYKNNKTALKNKTSHIVKKTKTMKK